jgi:hypothetical protein
MEGVSGVATMFFNVYLTRQTRLVARQPRIGACVVIWRDGGSRGASCELGYAEDVSPSHRLVVVVWEK